MFVCAGCGELLPAINRGHSIFKGNIYQPTTYSGGHKAEKVCIPSQHAYELQNYTVIATLSFQHH